MDSIFKILQGEGRCFVDEPLNRHCSIGVGGRAKIFALPKTLEQLVELVGYCEDCGLKYFVAGNFTNLVFDDDGFDGVVISTKEMDESLNVFNNTITCGAGTKLSRLASFAAQNGLSGLEWACGIPGTVGGAVVQNAGAFDKSMAMVVSKVLVYENRKLVSLNNEKCEFGYRSSAFKDNKEMLALDASFGLVPKSKEIIFESMNILSKTRILMQPKGKSAGSVFKNPKGVSAGFLLENAGMKGRSIGGASFSNKHANFIINDGTATFLNVVSLIDEAKEKVYTKFGIWLECEIEIVRKD